MSGPLPALERLTEGGWLVGGAVRDRLLGRPTADFDVVVREDPRQVARALSRAQGAHAFSLSDGFGAWRVVARDRRWQVDLTPLAGETIEADLAQRDLSVNAIAEPLGGGAYIDPLGGLKDLRAGRLRMVSRGAFAADPLRTIRLARLACELGFEVDPATASVAGQSSGALDRVAAERVFAELKRIVVADRALEGLALMDTLGVTASVLPELTGLQGVEQSRYHHLDVYGHTKLVLAETIELQRGSPGWLGEHAAAVEKLLDEPLADELTRGQALRFGALFHDVAKPQTRSVTAEGRVTFMGHDQAGAEMATAVLRRLRASERLAAHVAGLARHHLRLGFLVHQMPLSRRAVYAYLRACAPVQVDVTVLSVADRLATRGRGSEPAIARHLELARQLLGEALAWRERPPQPPMRGHQLAQAVGIGPGPALGHLLEQLEEASFAGEIASTQDAIELARELLGERPEISDRLRGVSDPDCIFCKIIAGELPGEIIDQDERTVAFMDISPATRGHALVVPRRHARDLLEIEPDELAAVMLAAQRLARRAHQRLEADGVNLINSCGQAAWQTVFHLHVHVIPRYSDDPLRLPWTPAAGDRDEIAAAAELLRASR